MNLLLYSVKQLPEDSGDIILTTELEDNILTVSMVIHGLNTSIEDEINRLQLSIIQQIVLNQNGRFDSNKTEEEKCIDIQLPIISHDEPLAVSGELSHQGFE